MSQRREINRQLRDCEGEIDRTVEEACKLRGRVIVALGNATLEELVAVECADLGIATGKYQLCVQRARELKRTRERLQAELVNTRD